MVKGAAEWVSKVSQQWVFFSRVFLSQKKNGASRLILDLHKLNNFFTKAFLANSYWISIINGLSSWSLKMTSKLHAWELKQVSPDLLCRRYFQYTVLLFGLTKVPVSMDFTKCVMWMVAYFRTNYCLISPYLDDRFIMARFKENFVVQVPLVLTTALRADLLLFRVF